MLGDLEGMSVTGDREGDTEGERLGLFEGDWLGVDVGYGINGFENT